MARLRRRDGAIAGGASATERRGGSDSAMAASPDAVDGTAIGTGFGRRDGAASRRHDGGVARGRRQRIGVHRRCAIGAGLAAHGSSIVLGGVMSAA